MADSRTVNNLASDLDFNCYCHVSGGEHNCLHCRAADRIASLESQLAEANALLAECEQYFEKLGWFEAATKLRGRERADG